MFADQFGAHRLNKACNKFTSLFERRADVIDPSNPTRQGPDPFKNSTCQQTISSPTGSKTEKNDTQKNGQAELTQSARRLSVQDKINLFETKQKEVISGNGEKPIVAKCMLRRWGVEKEEIEKCEVKSVLKNEIQSTDSNKRLEEVFESDLGGEKKEIESLFCIPENSSVSHAKFEDPKRLNDIETFTKSELKSVLKDQLQSTVPSSKLEASILETVETHGKNQSTSQSRSKFSSTDRGSFKDLKFGKNEVDGVEGEVVNEAQVGGLRACDSPRAQFEVFASSVGDIESAGVLYQCTRVGITEGGGEVGLKDQSVQHSRFGAFPMAEVDSSDSGSKNREAFAAQYKGFEGDQLATKTKMKSLGQVEEVANKDLSSSERQFVIQRMKQNKKLQDKRDAINKTSVSGKLVSKVQEGSDSIPVTPVEQVQRLRQSKGNQELNDELRMKANELEKLFAEHKLRVPGDQSSSSRRTKLANVDIEQGSSLPHQTLSADIDPLHKGPVISSPGSSNKLDFNSPDQTFPELGFSDDSKGKFYDSYMQIRDAKLKEEWSSKGAEKEAKMKAMQESLERSRAEMSAKFSGSDKHYSVSVARRHAETIRPFNTHSTMKRNQPLDFLQSEDDEDQSEFLEQKPFGYDRSFCDTPLGDGVSRSFQSKKLLPNKTFSSSTPRSPAATVPRSATKPSNSSLGRRRMQPENLLMQSVPNFSDLRKENTKPSSSVSKTTRSQLKNYSRNRSPNEETSHVKDEKSRRSVSSRKSSANPVEFNETTPLKSEDVVLTPLTFDLGQTEQSPSNKFSKNAKSKPNNSVGISAAAAIAEVKASMMSVAMSNEEESEELTFEPTNSLDLVKDVEEEGLEIMTAENHVNLESEKLVNSGSHAFSRIHYPFSYTHEASDIDASAYSPVESPASWSLLSLNQTEADAARVRKKWGNAQKPIIVSSVSNNQSQKDVTKGFKRLLYFGRKTRGTEGVVDWVSTTTSEGDDDMEDGRDLANQSSEDLRKSKVGFFQGHSSKDSFSEGEFFSEQVQALRSSIPAPPANFKLREDHLSGSSMKAPRSFFSLSSFRSKGTDSKAR